jgi:hypothetical protein
MNRVKALWASLPSWAKGCIFIGGSAASGAIKKYVETPNACLSLHCLAIIGLSALHVGSIAAVGWLMQSPAGKTLLADVVAEQSQAAK